MDGVGEYLAQQCARLDLDALFHQIRRFTSLTPLPNVFGARRLELACG